MAIKVLYVHGIGEIGGAETDLLVLLRGLDRKRFEPFVVCPPQGPLFKEIESLNFPVHGLEIPAWRKVKGWLSIPSAIWKLKKVIQAWQIQLIHVNDYWWNPLVSVAAQWSKIPVVVHVRQQIEPCRIAQYGLNKPSAVFAVSQNIADVLLASGVPNKKVHVVYSGIELSASGSHSIDDAGAHLNGGQIPQPVIGTIANIFPRKGYEYLIEALHLLRIPFPNIRCLIVGKGDTVYLGKLHRLVREKSLDAHVEFVGFQENVYNMLDRFDVFVLPSVMEGFGLVLLEAMALKKPVVATSVGGIPEVVQDGVTGILVSPRDPKPLAEAIQRLLQNPQMRFEMGAAGRARVERCFSREQAVRRVQDLYQAVVST